jgi:hypothetical protein
MTAIEEIGKMNALLENMLESNKLILRAIASQSSDSRDKVLTSAEAAAYVGVGYQYFMSTWRKMHMITPVRRGGSRLTFYRIEDLDRILKGPE